MKAKAVVPNRAPTEDQIREFILDLVRVCRKHGLSLSHEDGNGFFLFRPWEGLYERWLTDMVVEGDYHNEDLWEEKPDDSYEVYMDRQRVIRDLLLKKP